MEHATQHNQEGSLSSILLTKFQANLKTYTMILALAFIWMLFGAMTDWIFFAPRNLSNLFRQMTIVSFLSMGMVLVIVITNIDLSVGSVVGFISAIAAALQAYTIPWLLTRLGIAESLSITARSMLVTTISIAAALLVGLLVGILQGSLIAYLGIPAFIVTLGGMLAFRGGVLGITQGKTIVPIEDSFRLIAQGYIPTGLGFGLGIFVAILIFVGIFRARSQRIRYGFAPHPFYQDLLSACFFSGLVLIFVRVMNSYRGIPNPVLLMGIVALIFTYLTNNTKFGRYSYALGGNKEATRLSGVNIKGTIFRVHILMGLLCGVSGIVLTGYVAAGTTGGGQNYELEAIAACVIGGTSFAGGEGSIVGALVGSLIMASLTNGMSVMNMPIFWQFIIRGFVLVIAVYIDVLSKKK
ncbi:sugar ABC transporter permease [candidate division KSB3 bacterium]|uniref:Xylose transport system permease protein XylH n=1 Tax=candidate division KSB3 bacterium TaxID=2044937 RepID=A0A2G6E6N7_9BACT|nr:MAG: sugar ABC transporter permease [candidate division KSB3 bacterium]PIE30170.1 MAG: sugar ABC transporter permease [candidate division KSB3 bacterium]